MGSGTVSAEGLSRYGLLLLRVMESLSVVVARGQTSFSCAGVRRSTGAYSIQIASGGMSWDGDSVSFTNLVFGAFSSPRLGSSPTLTVGDSAYVSAVYGIG